MENKLLNRVKKDWENKTDEKIEVTFSEGCLTCFSSELATLKLFKIYNNRKRNKNTEQGYSKNLKSFYFILKLNNK